mmetsp:Transcript_1190/g.2140  ORF Transcript_1190/g.2140 Transcript_1190/m.2140 type:complete len:95 (+) Transcript_1190:71-355(+)
MKLRPGSLKSFPNSKVGMVKPARNLNHRLSLFPLPCQPKARRMKEMLARSKLQTVLLKLSDLLVNIETVIWFQQTACLSCWFVRIIHNLFIELD